MDSFAPVVALVLTLAPSSVGAQEHRAEHPQVPQECASYLMFDDADLDFIARMFHGEGDAEWRQRVGVERLSSTVDRQIVSDPATCRAIMLVAQREMQSRVEMASVLQERHDHTILSIGPYYVAAFAEHASPSEDSVVMGTAATLMILRSDDLSYIDSFALVGW